MAVEKKTINIGKEYKDTFDSLYALLSMKKLEDVGAVADVDGFGRKIISTSTCNYVYSDSTSSADEQTICMNSDGASWFEPMRGGKPFNDGSSEWEALISDVAAIFHKTYSIIEYKQCGNDDKTDAEESAKAIKNIVGRLFNETNVTLSRGEKTAGSQDIYGAFVKLDLGGTGQSCFTVMCKIYFRRTGKVIRPISAQEASVVNAKLEQAPPNDDPVSDGSSVIDETLYAMDKLVKGEYVLKLKDCLCFSERKIFNPDTRTEEYNYDLRTVKNLVSRAIHNNSPVACTSIKVLSISHVKWLNECYDVSFGGKPVLRAVIGFGGSISIRCINCQGADELIDSNAMEYTVSDKDGNKTKRIRNIFPERADLGLDDAAVAEIKKYSEIANHLNKIVCNNVSRTGKTCTSYACRSQVIKEGKSVKCANCPYPEEVYTDYTAEVPVRCFTSALKFAYDKMAMVRSEGVGTCGCCGRPFTHSALKSDMCPLCLDMSGMSEDKKKYAARVYKKYKNVLSHTTRLKHLFHKKYCLEDDTVLLFALGGDRYVLSKLELAKKGYIKAPTKIGRR